METFLSVSHLEFCVVFGKINHIFHAFCFLIPFFFQKESIIFLRTT